MTDSTNRRPLPRRLVVTSYAVSVGGFLMICMIGTGIITGSPWYGLLVPVYAVCALETLFLVLYLCPMVLGLSGFVISLRRPERRDWFICGHFCLVVYYVLSVFFALLAAVASA